MESATLRESIGETTTSAGKVSLDSELLMQLPVAPEVAFDSCGFRFFFRPATVNNNTGLTSNTLP